MSDIAVKVEGLGKEYRIGKKQERYRTFRDAISDTFLAPFRRTRSLLRGQAYGAAGLEETIWALRDVSFEIKHGEAVGIIGRNGAGKSTLLKILSRITDPTLGYIDLYGRVGALLEVGTGFHPELTGRENIYLNGAILGMPRTEIDRKFDEIVAFAEVETFIDTPIKYYSSGMGLRLGFAVAAHLEPDILVVDEVLAVGDVAFQKKCLGKMEEVATKGRTVLFVSHNMSSIMDLCQSVIWLDNGRVHGAGETVEMVRNYMKQVAASSSIDLSEHTGRIGQEVYLKNVWLLNEGVETAVFQTNDPFTIRVECEFDQPHSKISLGLVLRDQLGPRVFAAHMNQYLEVAIERPGTYLIEAYFDKLALAPGAYGVSLYLGNGIYDFDVVQDAIFFEVVWNNALELLYPPRNNWGPVFFPLHWSVEKSNHGD